MTPKSFITCLLIIASTAMAVAQKDTIPDFKYFPPQADGKNVALVLFGGSEGGLPNYYDIDGLTKLGYPCLILGYFGTQHTPNYLEMIPLEYFEKAIKDYQSQPEVNGKKIVVWGGSKGGELVLLLASRYKEIAGVIAAVPSSVVFQGLGPQLTSSWSYGGIPLPFVPYAEYDYSKIVNSEYLEPYILSLQQTAAVEAAAIKVENINGPILLLAGKEDTMWPSDQMCQMIIKRLDEYKFPHWYKLYSYENAGHTLNDEYLMGGTPEGNKEARIDSQKRTLDFLERISAGVE